MPADWHTLSNEAQLTLARAALLRAAETIAGQAELLADEIETGAMSDPGGADALRLLAAVVRWCGGEPVRRGGPLLNPSQPGGDPCPTIVPRRRTSPPIDWIPDTLVIDMVRRFAQERLAPHAAAREKAGQIEPEVIRELGDWVCSVQPRPSNGVGPRSIR